MPENTSPTTILSGFAKFLVQNKVLEEAQVRQALNNATSNSGSFISYIFQQNWLAPTILAQNISKYFSLPLLDLDAYDISFFPNELLNAQFFQKKIALPLLKKNGTLFLAVTDPTLPILNEIKFVTRLSLKLIITPSDQLQRTIDNILSTQLLSGLDDLDSAQLDDLNISTYEEEKENIQQLDDTVDNAPVVRYVNKILLDAINKGASDIHFEPYEGFYRIRFRQDGILHKIASPPAKLANYIVARIKVISNLNTAERRIPQDGRFKLILSAHRSIDFRVSTCPTLYGEKVVMRLLAPAQSLPNIDSLGMTLVQQAHFSDALTRSQGIILVSGPTGSGKTVTLYTALNILNTGEENISTVEDPVEIPVAGINQVHVNQKTGLTFSAALRSFLRQDPDIIMVGEIRDLETAEIAVKAAQTGHLVLSTVHTNSAVETITRLSNMGIAPFNIASALILIIAQRLARRLCERCKKPVTLPEEILLKEGFHAEEIKDLTCYEPNSCDHCYNGYKGRVGIFEVLPISPSMIELILSGASAPKLAAQAQTEGIKNLRQSGLEKVKAGLTSLAELNRVIKG